MKVSCSRTQHNASGEPGTSRLSIPSLMLYQLSHCSLIWWGKYPLKYYILSMNIWDKWWLAVISLCPCNSHSKSKDKSLTIVWKFQSQWPWPQPYPSVGMALKIVLCIPSFQLIIKFVKGKICLMQKNGFSLWPWPQVHAMGRGWPKSKLKTYIYNHAKHKYLLLKDDIVKLNKRALSRALNCCPDSWHMSRWCIGLWLKRYDLKLFLFSALVAMLNILINFSRGSHEEHFCEIILNLDQ